MKIAIVGCSGSGKTRLAEQLAQKHGLEHIEMDSMAFYEDWTLRPVEEFKSDIQRRIDNAATGWITDGNWSSLDGIHTRLADQIIWIDLPRSIVMRQLIPRTIVRVLTRKRLWGTNREPFTNLWSLNPEKNVILWSWKQFHSLRRQYEKYVLDGSWSHATVTHLRSRKAISDLLDR
ncbi:MAG TPA: adenylate kinase [Acidimicrobiaceae bacterium]|nr:adenylate kinase [Acidimicrobiaceae bacterium]